MEIAKVNPGLFRDLKYKVAINPDILNPRSEELERAFGLETYDRMIAAPPGMFDPEETAKLLLTSERKTKNDPDKYLAKQPAAPVPGMPPEMGQGGMPNAGNGPLQAMGKKSPTQGQPALASMPQ